ncbi:hypothetical protein Dimus_035528, partial [Dionaea muscipula]
MAILGVKGFYELPMPCIGNVLLRGARGLSLERLHRGVCGDGMWTIPSSVPSSIIETHELSGMTLEYRRECGRETMSLRSLADVVT